MACSGSPRQVVSGSVHFCANIELEKFGSSSYLRLGRTGLLWPLCLRCGASTQARTSARFGGTSEEDKLTDVTTREFDRTRAHKRHARFPVTELDPVVSGHWKGSGGQPLTNYLIILYYYIFQSVLFGNNVIVLLWVPQSIH